MRRPDYPVTVHLTRLELLAVAVAGQDHELTDATHAVMAGAYQTAQQKLRHAVRVRQALEAAGLLESCGKPVDNLPPSPHGTGGPGTVHRFSTKRSTGRRP